MPARLGMWIGLLVLGVGTRAALAADSEAVVVGITQSGDLPADLALRGAQQRAEALSEVLQGRASFTEVRLLKGASATKAALLQAFTASLEETGSGGLILWVVEGHGVGGDYGDPLFLPADVSLERLEETAIDMGALAHLAASRLGDRALVVVLDSSHAEAHERLALVGATVDDWSSAGANVGVVSAAGPGQTAEAGALVLVVTQALDGAADGNADGRITWSEFSEFVVSGHGSETLTTVQSGGALSGDRTIVQLPVDAPVKPPSTASAAGNPVPWKAISWGLIMAGGVSGAASLGMYAGKRSGCERQGGQTSCGSGAAYGRYQRTQHALGWVGGGLIVAGVGLQFVGLDGPVRVRVGGRF